MPLPVRNILGGICLLKLQLHIFAHLIKLPCSIHRHRQIVKGRDCFVGFHVVIAAFPVPYRIQHIGIIAIGNLFYHKAVSYIL